MSNVIPLRHWHAEVEPRHIALWHHMGAHAFFHGLHRGQCPWDALMEWPCARLGRAYWMQGHLEAQEMMIAWMQAHDCSVCPIPERGTQR